MTMMLVARAIERIGDNAVDIGEQVAFVVTGLFREFEDASHPGESATPADCPPPPLRSDASAVLPRSTRPSVLCAAIDIGSNTTRVLVAEPEEGQLRTVMEQRAYTRIGKDSKHDGSDHDDEGRRGRRGRRHPGAARRGARRRGDQDRRHGRDPRGRQRRRGRRRDRAASAGLEVEVLSEEEEGTARVHRRHEDARTPGRGRDRASSTSAAARRRSSSARSPAASRGPLLQDRLRLARRGPPRRATRPRRPRSARCATTSTTSSRRRGRPARAGRRRRRQRHLAAQARRRGARVRDPGARRSGPHRRPDRRRRAAVRARPAAGRDAPRRASWCSRSSPSCSGQPLQIGKGGLREGVILDPAERRRQRGADGPGRLGLTPAPGAIRRTLPPMAKAQADPGPRRGGAYGAGAAARILAVRDRGAQRPLRRRPRHARHRARPLHARRHPAAAGGAGGVRAVLSRRSLAPRRWPRSRSSPTRSASAGTATSRSTSLTGFAGELPAPDRRGVDGARRHAAAGAGRGQRGPARPTSRPTEWRACASARASWPRGRSGGGAGRCGQAGARPSGNGPARVMKARKVKKLDPRTPAGRERGADRPGRLDELRSFAPEGARSASAPAPSTTCGSPRSACATCSRRPSSASGAPGPRRASGARDLQDVLGELHDCDVMLPRVRAPSRASCGPGRRRGASPGRRRSGPRARARGAGAPPHRIPRPRRADVYLTARRKLLFDRFSEIWEEIERDGEWDRLDQAATEVLREAKERRRTARHGGAATLR